MEKFHDTHQEDNYKVIFENFYRPLVNFATSRISDSEIAEDIVQEVFVYIWSKKLEFNSLLALKTYLYRSTLNRCRNYIRNQKLRQDYIQQMLETRPEHENSLMNEIIREEVYRQLTAAMDALPPQCHKIYEMAQEGLTSTEIARQLGLAVETVKRQRKIARKILQDKLRKYIFLLLFFKFL